MRDLAANLYGIIVCNQSHDERILETLDDFYSALSDKVFYFFYSKLLIIGVSDKYFSSG